MLEYGNKTPTEIQAFNVDFSLELGNDIIQSVTVTAPDAGIVIDSDSFSGALVSFVVSGGDIGGRYAVKVAVTTAGSQVMESHGIIEVVKHG